MNSFINGGNTRIKKLNVRNEITVITKNRDIILGSFNPFFTWLHKLHTIFEITNEHIIKSKKSLKVHTINIVIKITANLKYSALFKLKIIYFFSEYPNPFDLA